MKNKTVKALCGISAAVLLMSGCASEKKEAQTELQTLEISGVEVVDESETEEDTSAETEVETELQTETARTTAEAEMQMLELDLSPGAVGNSQRKGGIAGFEDEIIDETGDQIELAAETENLGEVEEIGGVGQAPRKSGRKESDSEEATDTLRSQTLLSQETEKQTDAADAKTEKKKSQKAEPEQSETEQKKESLKTPAKPSGGEKQSEKQTDRQTEAQTEVEDAAKPVTEAEKITETETETETEEITEAETETETEKITEAETETETEKVTEAETETETEEVTEAETETETEEVTEAETETETEKITEAETETETEEVTEAEIETETEKITEAETETEEITEAETETETETEEVTETETETETEEITEAATETETEEVTEVATETETEKVTEAETETETEEITEAATETETEEITEAETETETEEVTEAETETETETETVTEAAPEMMTVNDIIIVRGKPSVESERKATLTPGMKLIVWPQEEEWVPIRFESEEGITDGYIRKEYLAQLSDVYLVKENINVRKSADQDSEKLGTLEAESRVLVLRSLTNGWAEICFVEDNETTSAYVKMEYLSPEAEVVGEERIVQELADLESGKSARAGETEATVEAETEEETEAATEAETEKETEAATEAETEEETEAATEAETEEETEAETEAVTEAETEEETEAATEAETEEETEAATESETETDMSVDLGAGAEAQFRIMELLYPDASRAGILYANENKSAQKQLARYESLASAHGYEITSIAIETEDDIDLAASELVGSVDVVFCIEDSLTAELVQTIAAYADEVEIPVIGRNESEVKQGCLAAFENGTLYWNTAKGAKLGKSSADIPTDSVTEY